jgi:hypothetical protein
MISTAKGIWRAISGVDDAVLVIAVRDDQGTVVIAENNDAFPTETFQDEAIQDDIVLSLKVRRPK